MADELKDLLNQILHAMLDRLLNTPSSRQLYLLSVHHEGLRNFEDYVRQQKLTVR